MSGVSLLKRLRLLGICVPFIFFTQDFTTPLNEVVRIPENSANTTHPPVNRHRGRNSEMSSQVDLTLSCSFPTHPQMWG